jgi:hypothetical protein
MPWARSGVKRITVIADAAAKNTLPLVAVERFGIALEGVDCQVREHTRVVSEWPWEGV